MRSAESTMTMQTGRVLGEAEQPGGMQMAGGPEALRAPKAPSSRRDPARRARSTISVDKRMVPIVVGLADEDSQSLGWTMRYQRELLSRRAPRRPAAMARPTRRPNHDAARAAADGREQVHDRRLGMVMREQLINDDDD